MNYDDLFRNIDFDAIKRAAQMHDDFEKKAGPIRASITGSQAEWNRQIEETLAPHRALLEQPGWLQEMERLTESKRLAFDSIEETLAPHRALLEQPRWLQEMRRLTESKRSALESIAHLSGQSILGKLDLEFPTLAGTWQNHLKDIGALDAFTASREVSRYFADELSPLDEIRRTMTGAMAGFSASLGSIGGDTSFAGLASLSAAIAREPYATPVSELITASLGTTPFASWSDPQLFDWRSRLDTYHELGVVDSLVDLPEPTFTEALLWSGLLDPSPVEVPLRRRPSRYPELPQRKLQIAYLQFMQLEDELRQYIDSEMTSRFGPSWPKHRVHPDIRVRWEKRRDEAIADDEDELPLIYYADLADYCAVITRKDNWKEVFGSTFKFQKHLETSFERLRPMRRCTAHFRPLIRADVLTIVCEIQRLRVAIGTIEKE